jgi:hypothetical protein
MELHLEVTKVIPQGKELIDATLQAHRRGEKNHRFEGIFAGKEKHT